MTPELTFVLLVSIVAGIVVGVIMYSFFHLYSWSSITMAIIVAYFIININYPIGQLIYERDSYSIAIYLLIEIIVPVYLLIVLVCMLLYFTRFYDEDDDEELEAQEEIIEEVEG